MGIHNRWWVVVAGAAVAGEVESITWRPERKNLFALGQSLKQMIRRFVGRALGAVGVAEQTGELALAHGFQRAAYIQAAMHCAVGRAEHCAWLVFCGHGASHAGACPGG